MRRYELSWRIALTLVAALAITGTPAMAGDAIEKYTATAAEIPNPFEISIERWTTSKERSDLIEVIKKNDSKLTLDALEQQARTGAVEFANSQRYDLYYAANFKMGDKRRLILVTNKPMAREGVKTSGAMESAMTIVDLTISSDGSGTGVLVIGADAMIDEATGGVQIVTSGQAPVRLQSVQLVE